MRNHREVKNHALEHYQFNKRLTFASVVILICLGLLLFRFLYLQIYQYTYFQTLAENNRISLVPIVPNRGLILDRNGEILAHNFFAYTLEITPSKAGDVEDTIQRIGQIIEITQEDKKQFRKLRAQGHGFESVPIRRHLNEIEAAKFAANKYQFPGVEIRSRLFRQYPHGDMGVHMIGYMGRINEHDVAVLEKENVISNYKGSDHIGKGGIEQFYEQSLHGKTGFQQVEVDANGQAIRVLANTPPVPGDNLTLSVDSKMQEIAEDAFGHRRGALVAMDPKTGEILSYVSMPTFDPNVFVDGIDSDTWKTLNESLDRPLINRPIYGQYPPGSTFKPFVALAGLEDGKRTPPFSISDPGYYALAGSSHHYRDWKPEGHGTVDIQKAITVSCDTFFYGLALDLGIEKLANFVGHFGFGKKTGIDLAGEVSGLLPTPDWKWKKWKQKWYQGETVIVGIGQGYTLVTPLQLAQAVSTLANNGVAMQPHLVKSIFSSETGQTTVIPPVKMDEIAVNPDNLSIVRNGMMNVTQPGGTAASVGAGATYHIAAKTGTAQVVGIKQGAKYNAGAIDERHRDHALFIAFAPAEDPKIAVAVIVENGGHGGSAAGPIARKVMDYYLLGKIPSEAEVKKDAEPLGEDLPHD
jgi:penicillin-binding protein 2